MNRIHIHATAVKTGYLLGCELFQSWLKNYIEYALYIWCSTSSLTDVDFLDRHTLLNL